MVLGAEGCWTYDVLVPRTHQYLPLIPGGKTSNPHMQLFDLAAWPSQRTATFERDQLLDSITQIFMFKLGYHASP